MGEIHEIVISKTGNEYTAKFRGIDSLAGKGESVESAIKNLITHAESEESIPKLSKNLGVVRHLNLVEIKECIRDILKRTRQCAGEQGLDPDRLPVWTQHARIRFGNQNHTIVLVIEDAAEAVDDIIEHKGPVKADVCILFNDYDMQPIGFFMSPYGNDGVLSIESLPDAGYPKSVILGQDVGFMCWPHFEPHRSFVLFELCFQQKLPNTETILSARKIPLAIYVHVDHLVNEDHRQLIADQIIKSLPDFSKSAFGDIYKQNRSKVRTLSILKKSSVIVLGSYRSAESIRELESVRDFVQTMEYSCNLIQDIADVPGMSNADKVEFWTKAARFCVMVDRDPSGHLVEYRILKAQDTIFAMLRPRSGGSTSMIGHEPMVNTNIIKVFEFEHAPLEVLKQATLWAEEVAAKRDAEYKLLRW